MEKELDARRAAHLPKAEAEEAAVLEVEVRQVGVMLEDPERICAYDSVCLEEAREESGAATKATKASNLAPAKNAVKEELNEYGMGDQDSLGCGASPEPYSGMGMN